MNILKYIPLFLSVFVMGCQIEEPKDNNCLKSLEDYTIYNPVNCKSLDRMSDYIQVYDNKNLRYDTYVENEYIDQSKANSKNLIIKKQLVKSDKLSELKVFFKDSILINGLILIIFLYAIMKQLNLKSQMTAFKVTRSVGFFALSILLLKMLTTTNIYEIERNKALQRINNLFANVVYSAFLKEHKQDSVTYEDYASKEALFDVEAINKINLCLTNSVKSSVSDLRFNQSRMVESDALDFYSKKNSTYFKGIESRDNRQIAISMKNIDGYSTVSKVDFGSCGSIDFNEKTVNKKMIGVMKDTGFKKALHDAIVNKNFEQNWKKIESSFEDQYLITTNSKKELLSLFILYANEYKKGMIVGSVLTDYSNGINIKESNFNNLTRIMNDSDVWYKSVASSKCYQTYDLNHRTIKAQDIFVTMNNFDCADFKVDKITPINKDSLNPNTEKVTIDRRIDSNIEEAKLQSQKMIDSLNVDYAVVYHSFYAMIDRIYDYDNKLVEIINKGGFAAPEFFRYVTSTNNEYKHLNGEIANVSNVNYYNALPYFNSNANVDTNVSSSLYDLAFVNRFVTHTDGLEDDITNTNVASAILEEQFNLTDIRINTDDDLTSNVKNYADTLANSFNVLKTSISKMTCVNVKNCYEENEAFDGVREWTNVQTQLAFQSINVMGMGITVQITGSIYEMLFDLKGEQGNNSKGFTIGNNKPSMMNSLGSSVSKVGSMAGTAGMAAFVFSQIMSLLHEIPEILSLSTQYLIPILMDFQVFLIIAVLVFGLTTNTTMQDYKQTISTLVIVLISPFITIFSMHTVILLTNILINSVLDNIPIIFSMLFNSMKRFIYFEWMTPAFSVLSLFIVLILIVIFSIKLSRNIDLILNELIKKGTNAITSNSTDGIETAENLTWTYAGVKGLRTHLANKTQRNNMKLMRLMKSVKNNKPE
ncbi:hypothetical protein CWO07_02200 [Vibrio splendidus]|uniref:Uncharacterized protein n=1 Tax=Vibrio splendidus TaxID=29497 RepID=A0A2T5F0Y4_VIBSP|nr:Yip1 family protein [Vibrio splendidus]PTP39401.1 hypothetical protein CWO07_02200 [Vibrio splendidus]